MKRFALMIGMTAALVMGSALALALTPPDACDELLRIGTKQAGARFELIRSDGQLLLEVHEVLCAADGVSVTTTSVDNEDTAGTEATTTTAAPASASFTCTRILSMSQGSQTFDGTMRSGAVNAEWEAQIRSGALLGREWVRRNFEGYTNRVVSPCSDRSDFRIVFLFDPWGSNWPQDVHTVIENIVYHNPGVDRIDLVYLIGLEGHGRCSGNGERATIRHNAYIDRADEVDLTRYSGRVGWGPHLDMPHCRLFVDYAGHLTDPAGENEAGRQMMAFYGE